MATQEFNKRPIRLSRLGSQKGEKIASIELRKRPIRSKLEFRKGEKMATKELKKKGHQVVQARVPDGRENGHTRASKKSHQV